jgi:hypothetical protein
MFHEGGKNSLVRLVRVCCQFCNRHSLWLNVMKVVCGCKAGQSASCMRRSPAQLWLTGIEMWRCSWHEAGKICQGSTASKSLKELRTSSCPGITYLTAIECVPEYWNMMSDDVREAQLCMLLKHSRSDLRLTKSDMLKAGLFCAIVGLPARIIFIR